MTNSSEGCSHGHGSKRAGPEGVCMSPILTATRESSAPVRRYPPADVLLAPPKDDVLREIVVDWQLPSDTERRSG